LTAKTAPKVGECLKGSLHGALATLDGGFIFVDLKHFQSSLYHGSLVAHVTSLVRGPIQRPGEHHNAPVPMFQKMRCGVIAAWLIFAQYCVDCRVRQHIVHQHQWNAYRLQDQNMPWGEFRSARETVAVETPNWRAISLIVAERFFVEFRRSMAKVNL
jgi:hypothetical protein